jgi:aryl-alcohol dehydrogenase-like predicted oxidoreductase
MPSSQSRHSRASTHSGPAIPRPRSCRSATSSASASFRGARSDRAFSPERSTPKTTFAESDVRSWFPRFTEEARQANPPIVDLVKEIAQAKDATPAQIALAWLLAQRPWLVPIPGTRKLHRLDENLGSVEIVLGEDELGQLDHISSCIAVHGARGTGNETYS